MEDRKRGLESYGEYVLAPGEINWRNADKTLEETREAMKSYYKQNVTPQPDIHIGNLVIVNTKHIWTKHQSKKLSLKLQCLFKLLEKRGNYAYKLEISPRWKINAAAHVAC